MENLTNRELELAHLVAQGFSNRQIAQRLGLSRQTVKNHVQAAYKKLAVNNRVELSLRLAGKTVEELRLRFVDAATSQQQSCSPDAVMKFPSSLNRAQTH